MLSISLVLIIMGLCATLGVAVHRATTSVGNETTILVTLTPGEDLTQINAMKTGLGKAPWCTGFDHTPATKVLAREVELMDPGMREGLELLSDNPFGDEFVLHIAADWRSTDSIAALSKRLQQMEAVDIVSADVTAMGKANDGLRRLILYLSILGAVLLLISIALITNTISLSIYSRRFTIHTMKLVGATNAFIRRPFVRAGMITGVIAGALAAIIVSAIQSYLMVYDNLVGPWLDAETIVWTALALVVLGALIARAAAWCAANSYLKKSYDRLYKK